MMNKRAFRKAYGIAAKEQYKHEVRRCGYLTCVGLVIGFWAVAKVIVTLLS